MVTSTSTRASPSAFVQSPTKDGAHSSAVQKSNGADTVGLFSGLLWKYAGRTLDRMVSGASGLRVKNLTKGWGDLSDMLTYGLDVVENDVLPPMPDIQWHGEWKEVDGVPTSSQMAFSPFKLVLGIMSVVRRFVSGAEAPIKYPKLLIREGSFVSPVARFQPEGSKDVHFRVVLPKTEESANQPSDGINWNGKMAVHFAATGDEGYSIRQAWYAAPLAMQHGIGSIIPIQTLYGKRRPKGETIVSTAYSSVAQVELMGLSTIEEGTSIVRWLVAPKAEGGLGLTRRVCSTGVSLGGSMAACVAARCKAEVAAAPIMASYGPAAIFTRDRGSVIGQAVEWSSLIGTSPELPPKFRARLPSSVSLTPQNEEDASALVEAILEQSASLEMLPPPARPDCSICVAATDDLYIPTPASKRTAARFGPQCTEVEVGGGHATGFMLHHKVFRDAVVEALARLEK